MDMEEKEVQLHGGNIWAFDRPVMDFSASVNPIGMPDAVATAARKAVAESSAYPDPACGELRRAISEMDGVPAEQVFCGNGAAELLTRLVLALRPKKAMVTAPTFGEYEQALSIVGCKVFHHYLKAERSFDVGDDLLRTLRPGLDLLMLCNPNNPTGRTIDPERLHRIAGFCEGHHIWLMVDESFLPLADRAVTQGCAPLLASHPHLILLRSMTKTYAMPGLRLGYLLSAHGELLKQLKRCGQPWSVSLPAQRAGEAACHCTDWAEKGRALVAEERPKLQKTLEELGWNVIPSAVNYLLFCAPGNTRLQEQLLEHKLLIRSCASFRGLGADWYRIAVRTPEENAALIQALEICAVENG